MTIDQFTTPAEAEREARVEQAKVLLAKRRARGPLLRRLRHRASDAA